MSSLTNDQLAELLEDIPHAEIAPQVFQIPLDDGSFAHLTNNTFVIGLANRYPDLEGTICYYIDQPPVWSEGFDGVMHNKNKGGFYSAVFQTLSLISGANVSDSDFGEESSD